MQHEDIKAYVDRTGYFTDDGAEKYLRDGRRAIRFDDQGTQHLGRAEMITIRGCNLLIRPLGGGHDKEFAIPIHRCRPWAAGEEMMKPRSNSIGSVLAEAARSGLNGHSETTLRPTVKLAPVPKPPTPSKWVARTETPAPVAITPEPPASPVTPVTPVTIPVTVPTPPPSTNGKPAEAIAEQPRWVILDRAKLELWHGGRNGDLDAGFVVGIDEAAEYTTTTTAHRAMERLVTNHPDRELYVVPRERALELLTRPEAPKPAIAAPAVGEAITLDHIKADLKRADDAVAAAAAVLLAAQNGLDTAKASREKVKQHYAPLLQEIVKSMGL